MENTTTTLPAIPANGQPTFNQEKLSELLMQQFPQAAFDISTLPIAPEFTGSLIQDVAETLTKCLTALNVPADVLGLANDLYDLSYYQEHCYHEQKVLLGENPFDLDLPEIINHLANVGGEFRSRGLITYPRPGTILAKAEADNE